METFRVSAVFIALCFLAPANASQSDNHAALQAIQKASGLPAIGYLVLDSGKVKDIQAAGLRQANGTTPVSVNDKWHIGGCAQAMTATVLARLIEKGTISWNTTLSDAMGWVSPELARVTVRQLLTHTSGLPRDFPMSTIRVRPRNMKLAQMLRDRFVSDALLQAPERRPGTTTQYSNLGYTVAGNVAESVSGRRWDVLLREELFDPLGIKDWGLGSPGIDDPDRQPWGHFRINGSWRPVKPGPGADFPLFLGPAGIFHVSLPDWARFIQAHLLGGKSGLLHPSTFRELHRPELNKYSAGWIVSRELEMVKNTTVWWHIGYNSRNFAAAAVFPDWNQAVLIVTNAFDCPKGDLLRNPLRRVVKELIVPQLGPVVK